MRVKIFTEASSMIGFGHAVRCSSLYQELRDRDIQVEYIVNGERSIQSVLPNIMMTFTNWLDESYLLEHLKDIDYAIVDSYLAPPAIYQLIAERTKSALYIDDYQRIQYPRGLILNPSPKSEKFEYYQCSKGIKVLTGWKYILLRSEFLKEKIREREIENTVLLLLGGTDVLDLASSIAKQLLEYNPEWHVNVVGSSRKHGFECSRNITFHGQLAARELKQLILSNKYMISAAGQTLFELLYLKKVVLPIIVVKNQKSNFEAFRAVFPEMLGIDASINVDSINEIVDVLPIFLSTQYREKFIKTLTSLVDGLGAKRGIDALLNL